MRNNFLSVLFIISIARPAFGQNASETELQEAFKFSSLVSTTMESYIRNALPPAAESDGRQILQNAQEGLRNCETYAQASRNINQYKECSSSLLHDGMAKLGALQATYRPYSSGASRIRLFRL